MKHGGAMGQGREDHVAALEMLNAFASVGATHFDLTWTDSAGKPQLFRRGRSLAELVRSMPLMLDKATSDRRNLIVRPYGPPAVFLQLDDLDAKGLRRVQPAAFLILDTSPGNHQAWIAMAESGGDDYAKRVRKGAGADPTASGATRVAGSLNFKDKYAPDFPRVAVGYVAAGRMMTPDVLEGMGLVAPAGPKCAPRAISSYARGGGGGKWPDYQRCLDGAPPSQSMNGPRHSIADYTWCLIAADWGWKVEDTARQLMEESAKAKENGPAYALKTATRAAAAAAERKARSAGRQRF